MKNKVRLIWEDEAKDIRVYSHTTGNKNFAVWEKDEVAWCTTREFALKLAVLLAENEAG